MWILIHIYIYIHFCIISISVYPRKLRDRIMGWYEYVSLKVSWIMNNPPSRGDGMKNQLGWQLMIPPKTWANGVGIFCNSDRKTDWKLESCWDFIGIYWGLNGDLFVGIVSFHMRPGPLWQVWTWLRSNCWTSTTWASLSCQFRKANLTIYGRA